MTWLKRTLVALAVLIALAAALPFLIPLDHYIPRLEAAASARLRQPVSIASMRFGALPLPHVTLGGIAIGKGDELRLGSVTVTPVLLSLLQSTPVIGSIEIDAAVATRKAIDMLLALAKADPAQPPQATTLRILRIRLDQAVLRLDKTDFGPFDAQLALDHEGRPADASVSTRDGKLKAMIKPDGANYLIEVGARAWTLPAAPALLFDELNIKGMASRNDLRLDAIDARLYGGTATGKMAIDWRKGLRVNGALDIAELELRQVAAMLSPGARVSGRLSAQPSFSAAAPAAGQLAHALRLESDFRVRDGVLHGVDIQQAATRLIKQGSSGPCSTRPAQAWPARRSAPPSWAPASAPRWGQRSAAGPKACSKPSRRKRQSRHQSDRGIRRPAARVGAGGTARTCAWSTGHGCKDHRKQIEPTPWQAFGQPWQAQMPVSLGFASNSRSMLLMGICRLTLFGGIGDRNHLA